MNEGKRGSGESRGDDVRAKYLTAGSPAKDSEPAVTLTRAELRELVRDAARAALGASEQLLVDKQGLALRLQCSVAHIDALRKRGLPTVRVGEAVRFEPHAVVAWLKKTLREQRPKAGKRLNRCPLERKQKSQ